MKKLPKQIDIDINGINASCIEVDPNEVRRFIPTIMYKDKYFVSLKSWIYTTFKIECNNAYFYNDRDLNKRVLRIIIDYPHKLKQEGIENLRGYENISISSGLSMEDESPYLIIEIS